MEVEPEPTSAAPRDGRLRKPHEFGFALAKAEGAGGEGGTGGQHSQPIGLAQAHRSDAAASRAALAALLAPRPEGGLADGAAPFAGTGTSWAVHACNAAR